MPAPLISSNFTDNLDVRLEDIFIDEFDQLEDRISEFYTSKQHNGRDKMTWGEVGAFGDWSQFDGMVDYDSVTAGYKTEVTFLEFVSGFQVEQVLVEDDQFDMIDELPKSLRDALERTRQKHAAEMFNDAFSLPSRFYTNTEGLALCSNSHTTPVSGVSTATGFDNLITTAFSSTALQAARIQFRNFRDDRGNIRSFMPDEIIGPIDIEEQVWEVLNSQGKVDTANNNANFQKGKYTFHQWEYLTDANNWFLSASKERKKNLYWVDRVEAGFAKAEDIDTMIRKYRGRARYGLARRGWRWIIGANVS